MRFAYPITLDSQRNGATVVSFSDVPEALTEGADEREALAEARDCLIGALGGYISRGWAIPNPSAAEGRPVIRLAAPVGDKLALYFAMRQHEINPAELAKQLDKAEAWIDQLLDLDEHSSEQRLDEALLALKNMIPKGSEESSPEHERVHYPG